MSYSTDEPDIFSEDFQRPASEHADVLRAKEDVATLSDEEFQRRYKTTKKVYSALIKGIEALQEVAVVLREPGAMEYDFDIIDTTEYLIEEFGELMEQMHMASYWEQEEAANGG